MKIKLLFIVFMLSILQSFASLVKYDPKSDCVFLDLRSLEEACEAHLDSNLINPSLLLPYDANFKDKVDSLSIYKERDIIIFCRTGRRAGLAKAILEKAGFKKLENLKTLQNAEDFKAELVAKSLERNKMIKKHHSLYIEKIGIKDDIYLLIDNANVARLNEIFDELIKSPDVDFPRLANHILSYLCNSNHINSYYLSDLHPFYADIKDVDVPENLKSAYAEFKVQQKKSMEMNAFFLKLRRNLATEVKMDGFLEPLEDTK